MVCLTVKYRQSLRLVFTSIVAIKFLKLFLHQLPYRLQLAVRDKLIQKQQSVLAEHGLDGKVSEICVVCVGCGLCGV